MRYEHYYIYMKKWRYLEIGKYKIKIDLEDFERLSKYTWRIRKRKDSLKLSVITSIRTDEGVRNVSLPHLLMKPKAGKMVYPRRYFEGFDFRKENLIVCSLKERQQMLPKKRKGTTSIYRGVSYVKKKKSWRAGISVNGKSINLGDFKSEAQAAMAYNKASKKFFGEHSYQNTIIKGKNRRV